MKIYVGVDWGSQQHAVCALDSQGERLTQFAVNHDQAGLTQLRQHLDKIALPQQIMLAIERPSGLLVDTLVEAGYNVVPIHPNTVKATRPRYAAA